MSGDDTQDPLIGHGFAQYAEPYPVDAGDRIEAMGRQIDVLRNEREKLAEKFLRRGELLAACRDYLRTESAGHLVARIDDEIGHDGLAWAEFTRGSVPIQGH